jgi:hypothetical protein
MSNSTRKTRQRHAPDSATPRSQPEPPENQPRFIPARPRSPQPWLLAVSAVLFGLWLILLLLLAVFA